MPGRRYSDGLHQALEAKEHVKVEQENQTLASITFQNYFRMYSKLAGMTGTADTEAEEFGKIYKLEVLVVPTNMPMIRDGPFGRDLQDGKGEIHGGHRGDQGTARGQTAGPRGNHLDRKIGTSEQISDPGRRSNTMF